MLAIDAASAATTWRLAQFGNRRAATIADPVIEPLWTGPRVLAFVERGAVVLTDAEGKAVAGREDVVAALVEATGGTTALIEGFLTPEPLRPAAEITPRDFVTAPKPTQAMSQMFIGTRGERKDRLFRQEEEVQQRLIAGSSDEVAFVAVDLLWLDDESLCDVPLLERKRVLESVITESHLVRIGVHVKPPVDTWLGSWRSLGFRRMSYKSANSRYVPGQKNQEWAQAEIPAR